MVETCTINESCYGFHVSKYTIPMDLGMISNPTYGTVFLFTYKMGPEPIRINGVKRGPYEWPKIYG